MVNNEKRRYIYYSGALAAALLMLLRIFDKAGVDLLFLPTWDWKVIAEEHFSVARLRAIQSETTLIRSVYDGWSAVIDSAGNVLVRKNTNDVGYENVFAYDVPVR